MTLFSATSVEGEETILTEIQVHQPRTLYDQDCDTKPMFGTVRFDVDTETNDHEMFSFESHLTLAEAIAHNSKDEAFLAQPHFLELVAK